MGTLMARQNNLEKIRGTHMGRGSQDGNLVPGSVENTPPPHSSDSRRRYPNAPCPCTESKEGVNIYEEYHTRLPEHGGLETHSDRVPARRHRGLVYFPEFHPMAGATDDQSYTLTEGLEEIKGLLKEGTPISWLRETLEEELWVNRYQCQGERFETDAYPSSRKARDATANAF